MPRRQDRTRSCRGQAQREPSAMSASSLGRTADGPDLTLAATRSRARRVFAGAQANRDLRDSSWYSSTIRGAQRGRQPHVLLQQSEARRVDRADEQSAEQGADLLTDDLRFSRASRADDVKIAAAVLVGAERVALQHGNRSTHAASVSRMRRLVVWFVAGLAVASLGAVSLPTSAWAGGSSEPEQSLPGVVRSGMWLLRTEQSAGFADISFNYGNATGDFPLMCDFTGTGMKTPVVFRAPGIWYYKNSLSGGNADGSFEFGTSSTDIPLCADINGSGMDVPVLFR